MDIYRIGYIGNVHYYQHSMWSYQMPERKNRKAETGYTVATCSVIASFFLISCRGAVLNRIIWIVGIAGLSLVLFKVGDIILVILKNRSGKSE